MIGNRLTTKPKHQQQNCFAILLIVTFTFTLHLHFSSEKGLIKLNVNSNDLTILYCSMTSDFTQDKK